MKGRVGWEWAGWRRVGLWLGRWICMVRDNELGADARVLVKLNNGSVHLSSALVASLLTLLELNMPLAQQLESLHYCIQKNKKTVVMCFALARRAVSHEADALSRGLRYRQVPSVPVLPTETWTLRRRKEGSLQATRLQRTSAIRMWRPLTK